MFSSTDKIEDLLRRTLERARSLRRFPDSTYRLQLHKGFTFKDATAIVPYLRELGVTHVYASPYLKARAGSTHGYDVIDHNQLNPEIGTPEDFQAFLDALATNGLSHILDTVPNHAGVGTNENVWWNDVLEHGPLSRFAGYFDIAWDGSPRPELHGKVLLPVLEDAYGAVLESGQLQLVFADGAFAVTYGDRRFPVNPATYAMILQEVVANSCDWTAIIRSAGVLSTKAEERHVESEQLKRRLHELCIKDTKIHDAIETALILFNGKPGQPRSFDLLDQLLVKQSYRLTYWKNASDEINYRRFFDINDLAALNMQREEVFEATHRLTLKLAAAGHVTGLRIDHPDGLHDPAKYFRDLQVGFLVAVAKGMSEANSDIDWAAFTERVRKYVAAAASESSPERWPLYVLGEKILAVGEPLPKNWALHGTSGYDFLIEANSFFVDPSATRAFTETYIHFTGEAAPFEEIVYRKKRLILETSLSSELQMLAHRLDRVAQLHRSTRDFTHNGLRAALIELIACFPVYRAYVCEEGSCPQDAEQIDRAIQQARHRSPVTDNTVWSFIRGTLLHNAPEHADEKLRSAQKHFAARFQQLTAPVTAKGVEDTAFYLYNRFISLNEVGGEPGRFGIDVPTLHAFLSYHATHWPYAMSALSTHDTKRSEDVRARLNVLSEFPGNWSAAVHRWSEICARHRSFVGEELAPTRNDEYLIYQTVLGAWPIRQSDFSGFPARVKAYVQKAVREGKVNSSWTRPHTAYEEATSRFIDAILSDPEFLADLSPLRERVTRLGLLNSLAQTLLRLTAPGVPDTYQGQEIWDFSLVDPDNRRPVDYAEREKLLQSARKATPNQVITTLEDGRAKLWVTSRVLAFRREHPRLFTEGTYEAVCADGAKSANVLAFLRHCKQHTVLVVIPRFFSQLEDGWSDTTIPLPAATWKNVLTDDEISAGGDVELQKLLGAFPVGLFLAK